jgi:hypothetical protein
MNGVSAKLTKPFKSVFLFFAFVVLFSCKAEEGKVIVPESSEAIPLPAPPRYLILTTATVDPPGGQGTVSIFSWDGGFIKTIRDLFLNGEYPSGGAWIKNELLAIAVEGTDRLEIVNFDGQLQQSLVNPNLSGAPLRLVVVNPDNHSVFVAESSSTPASNQIERFDVNPSTGAYTRTGNPFIPATVGSCSLTTIWGMAFIPGVNRLAVISSAATGRLSVYNAVDGTCVNHVTAAPFNANTPTSIAYHAPSNKLIVGFTTNHALVAVNIDGTAPSTIFQNAAFVNLPRALATDSEGSIYVASAGTRNIVKLHWTGMGSATVVGSANFMGPSSAVMYPTSIIVVEPN